MTSTPDRSAVSNQFWNTLDTLVASSTIIIDRPRGTPHPHYPDMIYPLDYGYLAGTMASDGGGIDVWVGSAGSHIVGIIATVDLVKRDAEIKILIGCTPAEIEMVTGFFRDNAMGYLPILRETIP